MPHGFSWLDPSAWITSLVGSGIGIYVLARIFRRDRRQDQNEQQVEPDLAGKTTQRQQQRNTNDAAIQRNEAENGSVGAAPLLAIVDARQDPVGHTEGQLHQPAADQDLNVARQ